MRRLQVVLFPSDSLFSFAHLQSVLSTKANLTPSHLLTDFSLHSSPTPPPPLIPVHPSLSVPPLSICPLLSEPL